MIRETERVLVPERGGEFGNFGAAAIDDRESWVTVAEGVWNDDGPAPRCEGRPLRRPGPLGGTGVDGDQGHPRSLTGGTRGDCGTSAVDLKAIRLEAAEVQGGRPTDQLIGI